MIIFVGEGMKSSLSIWSLRLRRLWLLFALQAFMPIGIYGSGLSVNVDSLMTQLLHNSFVYQHLVSRYDATLYTCATMHVRRRNFLLRYLPFVYNTDHRRHYIMESLNDLQFTAPDLYDCEVRGLMGTVNSFHGVNQTAISYFHLNIFAPYLGDDQLCSPISGDAAKYYYYKLDSVFVSEGETRYRITVMPRYSSFQLVQSGYIEIGSRDGMVRRFFFKSRNEYMRVSMLVTMGTEGREKYLPVRYDLSAKMSMVGNKFDINYLATLKYNHIELFDSIHPVISKKDKYNVSDAFHLTGNHVLSDTTSFLHLRPVPLTEYQQGIYRDFPLLKKQDSIPIESTKDKSYDFWGEVGDHLLRSYNIDMRGVGDLRCSPIFNPLLLNYSHTDGVSYKQVFKYNRLMSGDRLLRIAPLIGYNSMHREFYFSVPIDYGYAPSHRAALHLEFGNGNRIYNTRLMDEIKNMPTINFDNMHLDYYIDNYLDFNHSIEVFNGFQISTGIILHRRVAMQNSLIIVPDTSDIGGLRDRFKGAYSSFAPRLRLEWTPGLYYYMNGRRKINLRSAYPTFSLDYERGINNVFGCTGSYERLELDMQYHHPIGLMRDLYLRLGTGAFTDAKEIYFVDYINFAKSNLPVSWNDDIGGVFQLLDRRWYNASDRYLRGHITYETPYLMLPHLTRLTRNVLKERLYLNMLFVPHLTSYSELGYGIGTHIFDVGIFTSFDKLNFKEIGCKLTFELFGR